MKEYVYFIQAENGGPIKIGRAQSIHYRIRELQTGNPYKLVCRAFVEGGTLLERQLHWKFKEQRLQGEWFDPSDELEQIINNVNTFDWSSLPEPPHNQKPYVSFRIEQFVEDLYATSLQNGWSYEKCADRLRMELLEKGFRVKEIYRHMRWFETHHKKRFTEKRAVTGLQLDVK